MELAFSVSGRIGRPADEVFEAVVDPAELSRYFTTGGATGRLAVGSSVMWDFADHPGAFPVEVVDVVANQRIVLRWAADEGEPNPSGIGASTTVTMTFDALDDGRTLVTIAESGWRESDAGLQASYGNCHGWTQMLCALKAHLEHGINLRDGMYR